jgi:hypothetical protein
MFLHYMHINGNHISVTLSGYTGTIIYIYSIHLESIIRKSTMWIIGYIEKRLDEIKCIIYSNQMPLTVCIIISQKTVQISANCTS